MALAIYPINGRDPSNEMYHQLQLKETKSHENCKIFYHRNLELQLYALVLADSAWILDDRT